MPVYDYTCGKCGKRFETEQTFDEYDRHEAHDRHEPLKCPECGSKKIERCIDAVMVITSKKS
jgi:putative FmdB family regulatory protein